MTTSRSMTMRVAALITGVLVLASACGVSAATPTPTGPGASDLRRYPEYLWVESSGDVDLVARVFAASEDGSGNQLELVIDNSRSDRSFTVVSLTVAGHWGNDGELEIFPIVSEFAAASELTVAPGDVGFQIFRGPWPDDEKIAAIDIRLADDRDLFLRPEPVEPATAPVVPGQGEI